MRAVRGRWIRVGVAGPKYPGKIHPPDAGSRSAMGRSLVRLAPSSVKFANCADRSWVGTCLRVQATLLHGLDQVGFFFRGRPQRFFISDSDHAVLN